MNDVKPSLEPATQFPRAPLRPAVARIGRLVAARLFAVAVASLLSCARGDRDSSAPEPDAVPVIELEVRRVGGSVDAELVSAFEGALVEALRWRGPVAWTHVQGAVEISTGPSATGDAGEPARTYQIDGELWGTGGPPGQGIQVLAAVDCATPGDCVAPSAEAFASNAAAALILVGVSDETLAELLTTEREPALVAVLREAQRRGAAELCPQVVTAVASATSDDGLFAAAGTAAELHCSAAVASLIGAVDTRRPEIVIGVAPALAAIGGAEAIGFLQAVAGGHEDTRARAAARQALRGMQHQSP